MSKKKKKKESHREYTTQLVELICGKNTAAYVVHLTKAVPIQCLSPNILFAQCQLFQLNAFLKREQWYHAVHIYINKALNHQ